jgi:hypothetical protein
MARYTERAAAVRRRGARKRVTARTAARRARVAAAESTSSARSQRKHTEPESISQAKVWDRKCKRYRIAGLCDPCSANAAWGHQLGFGDIPDPCSACQPTVNAFDTSGPKGSKWRKCLIKLEYLTDTELAEVMA